MKKEAEEYENDFCTLFFYNGRPLDAIAGKEGEGLRRDRLAADHDGDGRRAGDRRCGADAAHGLGGRDHLLRCKDGFPDGEAAGLCLERPGQCRESGRIVSRNGDIGGRGLAADSVQGRLQAGKLCRRLSAEGISTAAGAGADDVSPPTSTLPSQVQVRAKRSGISSMAAESVMVLKTEPGVKVEERKRFR